MSGEKKYRNAFSLAEALQQWLADSGLAREHAVHRIHREWTQIVGPALARQTRQLRYEQGVLTVEVESAAWRHELTLARERLRDTINTYLDIPLVQEIKVR
ncbi:MAG: DUF721 domain-containing protein [Bacteroidetes bacterium]|jgi:predicted nucleic acid-binding Zn ribbon protein|nr:DUF721 domain-containing protein [Bacteroidota bacterium]